MEDTKIIEGYATSAAGELWYKVRGEVGEQACPLILVHGGPGFTSFYLEPLMLLEEELPVVRFDQAGCGKARRSGARQLFTIESFVQELEALRESLGVPFMHLLGHSFGGLVVAEYTLQYPQRVRSLILASVSIDIPRWRADSERLRSQLPLITRMVLREGERIGAYTSPQYIEALRHYYDQFVYRFQAKPEVILQAERDSDPFTYTTMWGPNELVVNGVVREYNLCPRLSRIKIPVLLTCGRFDEATPEAHEYFASLLSNATLQIFEQSAHHPHLNETQAYLAALRAFLKKSTQRE